jgi:hypothetical protein
VTLTNAILRGTSAGAIRERMARLGHPVDDLDDGELRRRAIGLVGRGALEAVARALSAGENRSRVSQS